MDTLAKPVKLYDDYHSEITKHASSIVRVGPWGEFETHDTIYRCRQPMGQSEFGEFQ